MKKKSFLAALMALVMLCTVFSCGITAAAADNTVAYGVDAYNYVKYLDENLRARRAGTEQETKAAAYITGELESFGYEVIKQPFSYTSNGATVNSQNLIVTKPAPRSRSSSVRITTVSIPPVWTIMGPVPLSRWRRQSGCSMSALLTR